MTGAYTGVYGRPSNGGLEKSLRETVRQTLLADVVRMDGGGNGSRGGGGGDAWRVMVLDARATRVISSVVGMYDIMEGHVTVVEDLYKVSIPGASWYNHSISLPSNVRRYSLWDQRCSGY